jgi:hypothetical protein
MGHYYLGQGRSKAGRARGVDRQIVNIPSNAPLRGNRNCAEQGVPAQRTGCYRAVRLAVCNEENQL